MRVLSGIFFFPRGGSAQVVRALAGNLPAEGCEVDLISGSLGESLGDADRFYSGLDPQIVEFDLPGGPRQLSYEDKPNAPDRCFATVDDAEYSQQVYAWSRVLERAGADQADVLLLNHLTPINEAANRVAPDVAVVGHLHGTELMMLENIAAGAPPEWKFAEIWARRMRRWAGQCSKLIVHTADKVPHAAALLGVDRNRFTVLPNGFDPESFKPRVSERKDFWRQQLVKNPQGWRPGEPAGSVAYSKSDIAGLDEAVILVAVGRFTEPKRLGLLIRAFEQARQRTRRSTALVLVGGHPGEWEGEHPVEAIESSGAQNVFLAGWQDHADLARFFNAADLQVLASVHEQFGLVLVEGMACALPPIAVNRFGPKSIIEAGRTGWLVPPDDQAALTAAIVGAVDDGEERSRRGIAARREAARNYAWPAIAGDIAGILASAAKAGPPTLKPADESRVTRSPSRPPTPDQAGR